MTNVVFSEGRPNYSWEDILQNVLDLGVSNSTTNTSKTSITLTIGTMQLVIGGVGLKADAARHFTAGTITSLTLISDGHQIISANSFVTPPSITKLQALLTEYDKPAPNPAVLATSFDALLRAEALHVTGSAADDRIATSTVGGDTINTGAGYDQVIVDATAKSSSFDGGSDFDFLKFTATFTAGVSVDFGSGEVRNRNGNILVATVQNFEGFDGTAGNDVVHSSMANDGSFYYKASLGNDEYQGFNESYTRVSYLDLQNEWGAAGGIAVNLAKGEVVKANGGTDHVWGVQTIQGTDAADVFVGDAFDNEFEGMNGADSFNGSGGFDSVNYNDEGYRDGVTRGVFINLSGASNTGTASGITGNVVVAAHKGLDAFGNTDSLISIERIVGTHLNDRLIGDEHANDFQGREGDDKLYGNGGDDRLDGNDGNDYLNGGAGNDDLSGGRGNDQILGGDGDDNINGGEGNDTIDAGTGNFDNVAGSAGTDTVQGGDGFDMLAFDEYDPSSDENGDGNPGGQDEHAADALTVTIKGGVGAGTVTGTFGISSILATPTPLAVNTSFLNLERVRGSVGNDSFTVGDGFSNTDDADQSFGDPVRLGNGVFGFVGGDGVDTFTDAARTGLALVDYDEEKWTHHDFNDDNDNRWGDHGEAGVAINASAADQTIDGFGTVAAGRAIDTWGNADVINGVAAFRLTDANDTVVAADIDTWVDGRGGDDTFIGGSHADQFNGGDGNDTATGGAGNDNLNGDDGNDTLNGGTGSDQLNGQNGNDTIHGDAGNDHINGDDGDDILFGDAGADNINGGNGADQMDGGIGNDNLQGDNDDDTLHGGAGDDYVNGGDGNDHVYGDDGGDRMSGGSGNDDLHGGLGDDRISGDDGNDTIYGDDDASTSTLGGADRLDGGNGDDTVFGGSGQDRIDGGDGNDTLNGGVGDDYINGGNDNDTLNGDDGEDQLSGGSGVDILNGGKGDDRLDGGTGNDTLNGGVGIDNLSGGDGNDTYVLANEASGVDTVYDTSGIDLITSTITRSLADFTGIENLTLLGTSALNATGNLLDNVLTGNSGINTLVGDAGNDTLFGFAGNDILLGGDGFDTLIGGVGKDTMTGGLNDDVFDFDAIAEMGKTSTTRDIIKDFSQIAGNRDSIDLHNIDADSTTDGDQAFTFFATQGSAFNGVKGALIWSTVDAVGTVDDKTIISGDINGDKVADFQIELTGLFTVTSGDFVL